MKSITIDGRLGKDAEVGMTKTGRQYLKFNVANNDFVSGSTVTEWYNVTSFDPYMIENFPKRLMKGRYVIVTGKPDTEVKLDQKGSVWLNHYVRATSIDMPSFGEKKKEEGSSLSSGMSTYTAGTPSYMAKEAAEPAVEEAGSPALTASPEIGIGNNNSDDDDLPF